MSEDKCPFDWKKFNSLCAYWLTQRDIADILDTSVDTLSNEIKKRYPQMTLADYMASKRANTKAALFSKMLWHVEKGNVPITIFMAKNILGFKDKVELSGDENRPILLKYNLDDPKPRDVEALGSAITEVGRDLSVRSLGE